MAGNARLADGSTPTIRLERHLPEPPATVWRSLTDPAELARWFPCGVDVEGGTWTVGAAIAFPFPSDVIDMTLEGTVLEVDKPRVLSYTWGPETLRFELGVERDGTLLVLFDTLAPETAARNAAGWDQCLDRLEGLPANKDAWRPLFDAYSARFTPVLGPQEGPPAGYKGDE